MPHSQITLFERFCKHLDELLPQGIPSVLIAYSGGADSSVMLDLFHRLSKLRSVKVFALHLDHNIRKEAAEDAEFCRSVCHRLNVPLTVFSEDVPAYAESHKLGIEEAARNLRYEILERFRRENNISYIATAHNATDNVETVLFHLARGTSLRGASGIPALTETRIRPLLPFTKSEILAYAEDNGISYRVDQTNSDTAYTRNYIRHNLLPHLANINPAYESAFSRFARDAKEDDDALYQMAEQYATCRDTRVLAELPSSILRRVLLIKYRQNAHNEVSRGHLSEASEKIKLAAHNLFAGELSFPDHSVLSITPTEVFFHPWHQIEKIAAPIRLTPDSDFVFLNRYRIVVTAYDIPPYDNALATLCIPENVLGALSVRSRLNGDRYRSGNMTRNIKKMLCDKKIHKDLRDAIPFILYEDTVLFVPHLPPSDLYQSLSCSDGNKYRISIYEV